MGSSAKYLEQMKQERRLQSKKIALPRGDPAAGKVASTPDLQRISPYICAIVGRWAANACADNIGELMAEKAQLPPTWQ